jgi:hypothetical protein
LEQSRIIGDGVYLTRHPQGIALYFRPFRRPGATLSLALFGIACLIPGLFAALALAPLVFSGASGMVAIWLMSIFILPFVAFGVLFVALAAYRLSNSLTVTVTASEIRSLSVSWASSARAAISGGRRGARRRCCRAVSMAPE